MILRIKYIKKMPKSLPFDIFNNYIYNLKIMSTYAIDNINEYIYIYE